MALRPENAGRRQLFYTLLIITIAGVLADSFFALGGFLDIAVLFTVAPVTLIAGVLSFMGEVKSKPEVETPRGKSTLYICIAIFVAVGVFAAFEQFT